MKVKVQSLAGEPESVVIAVSVFGIFAGVVMWLAQWKRQQDTKLANLLKIAHDTYLLSNSHMGEQLLLNRNLTERVAEMTGKDIDINQASLSNKRYEEHLFRQSAVDDKAEAEIRDAALSKEWAARLPR
jgi:hypothetical protein